jgi:plasmid stability protein
VGNGIGESFPHQIYLPLAFTEGLGDVSAVRTRNKQGYETTSFDGVVITAIDTTGDVLVTIRRLTNTTTQDRVYLYGTDGILEVDVIRRGVFKTTSHGVPTKENFLREHVGLASQLIENIVTNGAEFARRALGLGRATDGRSHEILIRRFYTAVLNDDPVPVPLEEAIDTMRVIDAVGEYTGEAVPPAED